MENPIELYASGTRILEKDPGSAIDLFTRALEISPNMVPAIYNRACAFGRIGKLLEAALRYVVEIKLPKADLPQ